MVKLLESPDTDHSAPPQLEFKDSPGCSVQDARGFKEARVMAARGQASVSQGQTPRWMVRCRRPC